MKPFEIYRGNNVTWGKHCDYQHYWVIVDVRTPNAFGCFPISSSCYEQYCFFIAENDPNFKATGLKHSSHIIYTTIVELDADELGKQLGELTGDLLSAFRKEAGV